MYVADIECRPEAAFNGSFILPEDFNRELDGRTGDIWPRSNECILVDRAKTVLGRTIESALPAAIH